MKNKVMPVLKKIGNVLKHFLLHNWGTKLISLVFAVLLWHYAVLTLNTTRSVNVYNVPVSVTSASTLRGRGLVLSQSVEDAAGNVRVTINTQLSSAGALTSDHVSVSCDLSSVTSAGTYTLPLQARSSYGTVSSITPDSVTLVVEAMATRNLPIDVHLEGTPAEESILSDPVLSSSTVTVTGPDALVSTLDSASVELSVEGLETDLRKSVPITLYDEDGEEVSSSLLTLSQEDVILSVSVSRVTTLPLLAEEAIIGANKIAEGYEITAIEVYPESLQVQGSPDVIEALEAEGGLTLSPIDVTGASSDVRSYCTVSLPNGANLVQNRSILVILRIERLTTTLNFGNVPIEIRGVDPSLYTYTASVSSAQVTVTGPESRLQDFSAGHIQLYVDMTDRGAGTHTMPVHCLIDESYEAEAVLLPDTIEVTLTAVPVETE